MSASDERRAKRPSARPTGRPGAGGPAEYAGRGDPRRTMDLLWGRYQPPTRGPRQALTVPEIVAAAIAVADEEGIGALSMRKVAERLGRSAMSLYTYVPGKGELLDLMLDAVLAEQPRDYPLDDGWRPAIEALARDTWDFFLRHRWVLQVSSSRSVLGPHELDAYEATVRLFRAAGMGPVDAVASSTVLASFVRGAATAVVDAWAAEERTGLSDDDWWNARAALLDELSADVWTERYPTLSWVNEVGGNDAYEVPADETPYTVHIAIQSFEFGLQRLLDGFAAYVEAQPPDP